MLSACDEMFVNDSIDAVKNKILKVSFFKIKKIRKNLRRKHTDEITQVSDKNKQIYATFFDTGSLEVIYAAEAILRERRKIC
ncbi:MAG: hypothetical protein ABRQ38_27630 [Candidatus Eremiobacterota bacterium]